MLFRSQSTYDECAVRIGFDEARLIALPSMHSLRHGGDEDRAAFKYLLWGDERPPVSVHEPDGPPLPFAPPDVIVQVIDATTLERHLELTLELAQLGRPLIIALNKVDEAQDRGLYINSVVLGAELGATVVRTVATMGQGIADVFRAAVAAVREKKLPRPQPPSPHIEKALAPLAQLLAAPDITQAFRVPAPLLLSEVAAADAWFIGELEQHFAGRMQSVQQLLADAARGLPRPLDEELHADRHYRAASLFEMVTRLGSRRARRDWRYWLDALFLNPQLEIGRAHV